MLHTFSLYVHDRPGVLNRVASLFRRRGVSLVSLTVAHSEHPGISRMTILVDIEQGRAMQIEANLYKLVDLVFVEMINESKMIARELVLIKIHGSDDFCLLDETIKQFHLRVVDRGLESLVLEATGTPEEIHNLVSLLRPSGILDLVRTGKVAMRRGPESNLRRIAFGNRQDTGCQRTAENRIVQERDNVKT